MRASVRLPGSARDPWDPVRLERWVSTLPPEVLAAQRWFAAKGRAPQSVALEDMAVWREDGKAWLWVLFRAEGEGFSHLYQAFLIAERLAKGGDVPPPDESRLDWLVELDDGTLRIREPPDDHPFLRELEDAFFCDRSIPGSRGHLDFSCAGEAAHVRVRRAERGAARWLQAEQSNSALVFGETLLFKVYRRLEPGPHPEVELLEYLSRAARGRIVPEFAGRVDYHEPQGKTAAGVLMEYLPGARDLWSEFSAFLALDDPGKNGLRSLATAGGRLGSLTAALHGALARAEAEGLRPQPFDRLAAGRLFERVLRELERASHYGLDNPVRERLRSRLEALGRSVESASGLGFAMRIHGDYHLGQVLEAGGRLVVIDFEGEPARPLAERRVHDSPLRDVAGMLRSLDYLARLAGRKVEGGGREAAHVRGTKAGPAAAGSPQGARARRWAAETREAFLETYRSLLDERGGVLPKPPAFDALLEVFEIEKALYELRYESENRPEWRWVPLAALEERAATGA